MRLTKDRLIKKIKKITSVKFQEESHEDVIADSNKAFPCIETMSREAWWISTENVLCTETCDMFCRLKFSHFEISGEFCSKNLNCIITYKSN